MLDREDVHLVESLRSLGIQVLAAPTVMRSVDDRVTLARAVLHFAASVREVPALAVQ